MTNSAVTTRGSPIRNGRDWHAQPMGLSSSQSPATCWRITFLSPALLEIAQQEIVASRLQPFIEDVVEADARDLRRWTDGAFDAVLSLGPFYHLLTPANRELAARELARVLRPGGVAFVAFIPRNAFLRRVIANPREHHLLTTPGFIDRLLDEGIFLNDVDGAFPSGYGVDPSEVPAFFARYGLEPICLLAAEGIAPDLQGTLATIAETSPDVYRAAFDAILRTAADPSILGMSNHILFIARKSVGQEKLQRGAFIEDDTCDDRIRERLEGTLSEHSG